MRRILRTSKSVTGAAVALLALGTWLPASAEQFRQLGAYQGHYSLVPTTFLSPEVAADYGITRGRDRALLNVSIIDPDAGPVRAEVTGTVRDLLGIVQPLEFEEILEGDAVYYLATVKHADQEVLRFAIDVRTPDGASHLLTFQQKTYWDDR
ncbi:MAG: DUF4426 domain-containing protein [Pseudomonadales bacterium]